MLSHFVFPGYPTHQISAFTMDEVSYWIPDCDEFYKSQSVYLLSLVLLYLYIVWLL